MDITMQHRILVCNVGWMERYQGLRAPAPYGKLEDIVGGGEYVVKGGHGHECCNFLPTSSGQVFGHFETSKGEIERAVNIGRLGAPSAADRVDHIDVVWVATHPSKRGRVVVGYYRDATVYRQRQMHKTAPTTQHDEDKIKSYIVSAQAYNARCLPLDERTIKLLRAPGWIGQASWWFPDPGHHPDVEAFIARVRKLLNAHRPTQDSSGGRSTDPQHNALVEKAAIAMVEKHYATYDVHSVEKDSRGWDLEVYERGAERDVTKPKYCVEVKGLSGAEQIVGVTPNEYRCIKEHIAGNLPSYRLAVVTSARQPAPRLLIALYDPTQKVWVDEITNRVLWLDINELTAAMLTFG